MKVVRYDYTRGKRVKTSLFNGKGWTNQSQNLIINKQNNECR